MRSFAEYRDHWAPVVDRALDKYLPPEDTRPGTIHRAMRYTVFAGGKRFRPVLSMLCCQAVGGKEEDALPAACAVEMVHAFSLIHDDLPAMDDDDMRRGKPSNHREFGEGIAVLAGDGLLNHAYAVLAQLPPDLVPDAVSILSDAVGTCGLIGGQVEDLEAEGRTPDLETVQRIHLGKTAALIQACCSLGVLAADRGREQYSALSNYGVLIGQAFQIVDDVLDETGGDEEFGKTAGKDRKEGKMTYPAAVGIDASRARAWELVDQAMGLVAGLPGEDVFAGLARRVVKRTH